MAGLGGTPARGHSHRWRCLAALTRCSGSQSSQALLHCWAGPAADTHVPEHVISWQSWAEVPPPSTRQTWGPHGPAHLAKAGERAQGTAQLDWRLGLEAFCGYQLSCVCSRQEAVLVICKHSQFTAVCALYAEVLIKPASGSGTQSVQASRGAIACR